MKIRVMNEPWYNGLSFLISKEIDQKLYVVKKLDAELIEDETEIIHSTGNLNVCEAQILMDDLWHCGIRPSEGAGSAGQLASTQKHLEDMRKLVFDYLISR